MFYDQGAHDASIDIEIAKLLAAEENPTVEKLKNMAIHLKIKPVPTHKDDLIAAVKTRQLALRNEKLAALRKARVETPGIHLSSNQFIEKTVSVSAAGRQFHDMAAIEESRCNQQLFDASEQLHKINKFFSDPLFMSMSDPKPPTGLNAVGIKNSELGAHLMAVGADTFIADFVRECGADKVVENLRRIAELRLVKFVLCYKSLPGILNKVFVRGKTVKDIIRGTIVVESDSLAVLGEVIFAMKACGYAIAADVPKAGASWSVTNLFFWDPRLSVNGMYATVEVQVMTLEFYLVYMKSTNHRIYESMRCDSNYYLRNRDEVFLNALKDKIGVDIVPDIQILEKLRGQFRRVKLNGIINPESDGSGFIDCATVIKCGLLEFKIPPLPPPAPVRNAVGVQFPWMQFPAPVQVEKPTGKLYPFLVDGSLRTGDNLRVWSDKQDLHNKTVEICFSAPQGGAIYVGIAAEIDGCYNGQGENVVVMFGRGKAMIFKRSSDLPNTYADENFSWEPIKNDFIKFAVSIDGKSVVISTPKNGQLTVPISTAMLHIGVLSSTGFEDALVHSICIKSSDADITKAMGAVSIG